MTGQIAAAFLLAFFLAGSVFSTFALQQPTDPQVASNLVVSSEASLTPQESSSAETTATGSDELPGPVDNMHHFMEYISQPAFEQIKTGLAAEPADRSAWAPIKSGALILAETSILVAMRSPDENADDWRKISNEVYQHGADLYQAARRRKFDDAKDHYSKMIDSCNRCHTEFADGKHQLEK